MPAELLQAFKATLEELQEADLLVHVIDISNPCFRDHIYIVEKILRELDLGDIPCLKVYNKADQIENSMFLNNMVEPDAVIISAIDSSTLAPFLLAAQNKMQKALSNSDMDEL